MIDRHFDAIDAEYCLAEGGGVVRTGGKNTARQHQHHGEGAARRGARRPRSRRARFRSAQDERRRALVERRREDRRHGRRRCASTRRPARTSASSRRRRRSAETAKRYRDVLNPDAEVSKPAADWMLENEPEHWSMLHTSLVADHPHGRIPLQRDSVRGQGDDRRAVCIPMKISRSSSTRSGR